MKLIYGAFAVIFGVSSVGWAYFFYGAPSDKGINTWIAAYGSNVRTPLFTAFFTVGSFLMTLKTTMLGRLKDAYDSPAYRQRYLAHRCTNPDLKYYSHLQNLSIALGTSIAGALITSGLQMTLGFSRNPYAVGLCCGAATACLCLVLYLTIVIILAHREWFTKIEDEKQIELAKLSPPVDQAEVRPTTKSPKRKSK